MVGGRDCSVPGLFSPVGRLSKHSTQHVVVPQQVWVEEMKEQRIPQPRGGSWGVCAVGPCVLLGWLLGGGREATLQARWDAPAPRFSPSQGTTTGATPTPATISTAWASWPCASTRSGSMAVWWASSCMLWNMTCISPGATSLWVSVEARLTLLQAPSEGLQPLGPCSPFPGPLPCRVL